MGLLLVKDLIYVYVIILWELMEAIVIFLKVMGKEAQQMNLLKKTITVFIVAVLLMLSVSTGFAETIYYYNGYFYSYINNDTVALTGWEKDQTSLAIPDTLNNRAVITIPDRAFYADSDITGIDFSNAHHLQNIGIYAFAYT